MDVLRGMHGCLVKNGCRAGGATDLATDLGECFGLEVDSGFAERLPGLRKTPKLKRDSGLVEDSGVEEELRSW